MKRALIAAVLAMTLGAGLSWAKLPAPPAQTDDQKAAAEAAKAKKAEADKKDADNLSKAQDRAAENFKRNQARGKTTATAKAPAAAAPAAGAAVSK